MYIYIYIYIYITWLVSGARARPRPLVDSLLHIDVRGLDSSIILVLRGGIPRPIGNFPESLSQAILVGIVLVGRFGVLVVNVAPTHPP